MSSKPYMVLMPEAVGDAVCATAPLNKLLDDCTGKRDVFLICSAALLNIFNDIKGIKQAYAYNRLPENIHSITFDWVIDLYSVPQTIAIASKLDCSNCIFRSPEKSQTIEVRSKISSFSFPAPVFNSDGNGRETNPEEPAWALEAPLVAHVLNDDFWSWIDEGIEPKLQFKAKTINKAKSDHFKNSVFLFPCGSANVKRWPIDYWMQLIANLQNENFGIHVFLGPLEAGLYQKFKNISGVEVHQSLNLREIAELINYSKMVIANDCGPMHIAASQDVPVLAIFGPTNPECWFRYRHPKKSYMQLNKAKENINSWGIILDASKEWEYWVSDIDVFRKAKEMLSS